MTALARFYVNSVLFVFLLFSLPEGFAQEQAGNTNATAPPLSAIDQETVQKLISSANQSVDEGKLDDALASVDSALQLDPHNAELFELRGTIYIQQRLWDRAESDYQSALKIDPTAVSFKYKLAEIAFLQKSYASARLGFLALENDPGLGELARFNVLLCDLLDFQETSARRDLDALDQAPEKRQAYYFGHAVWELYHKNRQSGSMWLESASRIFGPSDMDRYLSSLKNLNALSAPILTFTTKQGVTYTDTKVFVEENGLRISTPTGWITVPFEQLPSDLSSFPADLQKQIELKEHPSPTADIDTELLSFTTKDGKKYDQVTWSIEEEGLRVLTSDGWITVPFGKLPEDLSHFPAELQKQIAIQQKEAQSRALITSQPPPYTDTNATSEMPIINTLPTAEASQFDLHPVEARDSRFGNCVAIQGNMFAIGANGATYVYVNNELKARLCAQVDSTQTGELVNSIGISNQTLVTGTSQGVYVWVTAAKGWKLQAHLDIPNPGSVAIDGDNLIVATNGQGIASNVISFYTRKGGSWQPAHRTIDRDGGCASADTFGNLVALKHNLALIGNPNWNKDAYDNKGPDYSGRVFIERFNGQTWDEVAQLSSTEAAVAANQFGQSVGFSGDLIAVSSTNRDNIDYAPHHGVVHLYQLAGNSWIKKASLNGPDPANDAGFGGGPLGLSHQTVAVTDPTVKAHVSNVMLDTGSSTGKPGDIAKAGAVYVYDKQILQDSLMAPDPADSLQQTGSLDQFGGSLAIDGDTLLIGAPGKDGGTGTVYVWKRQNNHWHLDAELKGFHKEASFNY